MFACGPADKYTLVYKQIRLTDPTKMVFLMFCLTTRKWTIKADERNKKFTTIMRSPVRPIENYINPLHGNRCHWQNNLTTEQFVVHVDNIAVENPSM